MNDFMMNLQNLATSKLKTYGIFIRTYGIILIIGCIFTITRLPFLTYPLGLSWRYIVKEGYRSYEAITSSEHFGIPILQNKYFEQPIYVFLLELAYQLTNHSPDALVFWGRVIGFLFSTIGLILIYKISDLTFGNIAAKFSAFLYSICPHGIFLGISIQRETLMWAFGLFSIYYLMKYVKTSFNKLILVSSTFALLSFLTKFTGIYFIITLFACLILFYTNSYIEKRVSFKQRLIVLVIFLIAVATLSFLLAFFSTQDNPSNPLYHSIAVHPEALLDLDFYSAIIKNAMEHIPTTTVLLGGLGFLSTIILFKKEFIIINIWMLITAMEFIFYGYGVAIHEYYILYFLHPLVILAGYSLFLLFEINIMQYMKQNYVSLKYIKPLLLIFLFIGAGIFPLYGYFREVRIIKENEPLFENIRTVGLFLKESEIRGDEIAIVFWNDNYSWWKFSLTLARTYIAKEGIGVIYSNNLTETIYSGNYEAIFGWSDDLSRAKDILSIQFLSQNIYSNGYIYPSIELWYNSN